MFNNFRLPGGYGAVYPQQGGNMWGAMTGYLNNALNGPGGAMQQMAAINAGNAARSQANRAYGSGSGGGGGQPSAAMDPTLARLLQYQSYYPAQASLSSAGLNAQSAIDVAGINAGAGQQSSYYGNVLGPFGTTSMQEGGKTERLGMLLPVLAGMFGSFSGGGSSPSGYTTNYGAGVYPMRPQAQQGQQTTGRPMPQMPQAPMGGGGFGGAYGGFGQGSNPFLQWAMQSAPQGQFWSNQGQNMGYAPIDPNRMYHERIAQMQAGRQRSPGMPNLTIPTLRGV